MQFALGERHVSLSVREFAEFQLGTSSAKYSRGKLSRAQLGTTWHNTLQEEAQTEFAEKARFEVPIKATWLHDGWRIEIQGRIDQIIEHENTLLFREVKTTQRALPCNEEKLLADYPHYLNQIASYLALASQLPAYQNRDLEGELFFVDITEGKTQSVPLPAPFLEIFEQQLIRLQPFLESRWSSRQRLSRMEFKPAFATLRDEQPEAIASLATQNLQSKVILFEAPTGFGKTGTALQYALEKMREGQYSRMIYLTGKSTGQIQALHQLKAMMPEDNSLRFFQLRNKREHSERCPLHGCNARSTCLENSDGDWNELTLQLSNTETSLQLDEVAMLSSQFRICPYEISRQALPFAEVWLCDYNYIFAPDNRNVLFQQPGFSPEQTLLVIDEAHNLPGRINDAYSFGDSFAEASSILNELQFSPFPRDLILSWEQWCDYLERIKQADSLSNDAAYEISEYLAAITQALNTTDFDHDTVPAAVLDRLYATYSAKAIVENESLEKLIWAPRAGTLRVTCLDAAPLAAETLNQFGSTLLMSATLTPHEHFRESLGLSENDSALTEASAPWREDAYSIAIDTRVDTRFKTRQAHYLTTAQTISQLAQKATGPVVAFFPSYRYAETIKTYIQAEDGYLQVAMQPRAVDLNGQLTFIEESLLSTHVLCFILGSGFSESIDLLGGRIEYAVVVGPALPEVNPVRKALLQKHASLGPQESFKRAYQIPAMQKINQALGRLVRAPGQKAKVLLHCRRFSDPSYHSLLNSEYRKASLVNHSLELESWIAEKGE